MGEFKFDSNLYDVIIINFFQDYHSDRGSTTFVSSVLSHDLLTPSSSSVISSHTVSDDLLSSRTGCKPVLAALRVKPSLTADPSLPVKIKLSEADVQLLGASISAADSSQNYSSAATIRIVTPSTLIQVHTTFYKGNPNTKHFGC